MPAYWRDLEARTAPPRMLLISPYDEFMDSPSEAAVWTDAHRPLYEVKANLFKGLSHPVRIRVLEVLSAGEASVTELLEDTGLEASHMSQHLAVLRRHHLVIGERRGSLVFYRLALPQVAELLAVARVLLVDILRNTAAQLESSIDLPEVRVVRSAPLASSDRPAPPSPPVSPAPPAHPAPSARVEPSEQ